MQPVNAAMSATWRLPHIEPLQALSPSGTSTVSVMHTSAKAKVNMKKPTANTTISFIYHENRTSRVQFDPWKRKLKKLFVFLAYPIDHYRYTDAEHDMMTL